MRWKCGSVNYFWHQPNSLVLNRGLDPGLQSKLPLDMFHIYYYFVCMHNFYLTIDNWLSYGKFKDMTPPEGSGGRENLLPLSDTIKLCDVSLCFCHFPMWCPGSGVVLDCIDSWSLTSYFFLIFRHWPITAHSETLKDIIDLGKGKVHKSYTKANMAFAL